MTGQAEVARQRQRLDAVFGRASSLGGDAELLSDFAKYLCVLVSGYLEQAIAELLTEYVRAHSDERVQQYVQIEMRRLSNLKAQRLTETLGAFDPSWRSSLQAFLIDEYKDAVDGIVDLRNTIAHGRHVGVTMNRVKDYYGRIQEVVEHVEGLCIPS